jgi:hypothetical protein
LNEDGDRGNSLLGGEASAVVCTVSCLDIAISAALVDEETAVDEVVTLEAATVVADEVQDENQDIGAEIGADATALLLCGVGGALFVCHESFRLLVCLSI